MRIIDCHAHLGRFRQTPILYPDAESMIGVMDAAEIETVCVSSFLSIGPDCRMGNDIVIAATSTFPGRFVGYAVVNPNRPNEIQEELDRCFQHPGMRAIKLHPAFHNYSIMESGYHTAFAYAGEHALPILSHEWGNPGFLEELSGRYPQIDFIIAHTGFWNGRSDFQYAGVLQRRPNVFVDLVYSNIYYEVLERMVEQVGAPKILWGSDFPLHDLAYQLGRVLFSKLNQTQRAMILGGNMLRILGKREAES